MHICHPLSPSPPSVADLRAGVTPLTSASRKPSSRRSSLSAPPPVQVSPVMGDPTDQLGAWSSPEQPMMRPPRPTQPLGKFQSLGNLHSLTKLPPHQPTFRPPNPAPPVGVPGDLHPDKRTASLCNIRMVDRLTTPIPPARYALQHPTMAPPSSNDGVLLSTEASLSGSLMRSASQPSLAGTRKQRSFDLDHIVSVISRDPSVSDLNSVEEMGVADPALFLKPEDNFLGEELQGMVGDPGGGESFQKKALAAKSMPSLNRPMGGQYSVLENFLMSPPGQVWCGWGCMGCGWGWTMWVGLCGVWVGMLVTHVGFRLVSCVCALPCVYVCVCACAVLMTPPLSSSPLLSPPLSSPPLSSLPLSSPPLPPLSSPLPSFSSTPLPSPLDADCSRHDHVCT